MFFEIGTLRKIIRSHRQTLLTDDLSDSIATHSFRVALIGYFIAKIENINIEKVLMMGLLHDLSESRCGDQNWINKRYVKVFEDEITDDQLGGTQLNEIAKEYKLRESKEAIAVKDADLLDQVLLLKEYSHSGNHEATEWLKDNEQIKMLKTKTAKKLASVILKRSVHDWWKDLWTAKRR